MVDSGRDDMQSSKSKAYRQLAAWLEDRDGVDDFKLTSFHHHQKLQKCYTAALAGGWTAEEMLTESSSSWMHDEVMWRIEQSGAVEFDYDYYRLAYDDSVAASVLIDTTVSNLQERFDAAFVGSHTTDQAG